MICYFCVMELSLFLKKIESYIAKHSLPGKNGKILVALSGGPDSVALLLALKHLGYNCVAAHCNFHLRGEDSNRDEQFVRNLVRKNQIPLVTVDFDVPAYEREHKVSTEMACRELRYEWFEQQRVECGCSAIAVGHHRDDKMETFFLNALRGSGITGLASIKPKNGVIFRPLLDVTRAEIEQFLKDENQDYVTDRTNLETEYKRNKVRNLLLPYINELFPGNALNRTLDNLASCNEFYESAIADAAAKCCSKNGDILSVNIEKLTAVNGAETLLFEILGKYGFNTVQSEEMFAMIQNPENTGKMIANDRYTAYFNRNEILVAPAVPADSDEVEYTFFFNSQPDSLPVKFDIKTVEITDDFKFSADADTAYFSTEILDKKILLRHWKTGDRMKPFGLRGTKKVSDIFSDLKLSPVEKKNAAVLEADGKIIWIPGYKNSDLFRCRKGEPVVVATVRK